MTTSDIVDIIISTMLLIICFWLDAACLGAAVGCFRERKRRMRALGQTAASYPVEGVVLDAKLVQDPPGTPDPLHYKYSLRYQDVSGGQHRAFLGISSTRPLYYAAGQIVPLQILQQSVIVPDTDAFNPARGANGIIDCPISFRKWLGKPIDETGTVLFVSDFRQITGELEEKIRSQQIAGWLWFSGFILSLMFTAGTLISLFSQF